MRANMIVWLMRLLSAICRPVVPTTCLSTSSFRRTLLGLWAFLLCSADREPDLAGLTVLLVALSSKTLFQSSAAGLVAGILASSHDYLRYTPNMMTIENWYIPALALSLYCAVRFLVAPTALKAVLLALAIGLLFGNPRAGRILLRLLDSDASICLQTPISSQASLLLYSGRRVRGDADALDRAQLHTGWPPQSRHDAGCRPDGLHDRPETLLRDPARIWYEEIRREWTEKYQTLKSVK